MYNYIMKKVLFCSAILLWVAIASYGCNDGPCVGWGSCGGIGGGMGSCALTGGACSGQCASLCPSGANDEYCFGLIGSCETSAAVCNTIITYACTSKMFGPPSCTCIENGLGGNCTRNDC